MGVHAKEGSSILYFRLQTDAIRGGWLHGSQRVGFGYLISIKL